MLRNMISEPYLSDMYFYLEAYPQKFNLNSLVIFFLRKDRSKLVLATKCGRNVQPSNPNGEGLSRFHIINSVEKSLKRLQTDYVDIFYVSRYVDSAFINQQWPSINGKLGGIMTLLCVLITGNEKFDL